MAGPSTITSLPVAAALNGTELVPMDQGGNGQSVRASVAQILAPTAAPATTALTGAEIFFLTQAGVLKQTTLEQIISQEAASASIAGTETLLIDQAGVLKKTTVAQVITQATAAGNPTATDVTGLVQSSNYRQMTMAQVGDFKVTYTDTGAANAYVITPSPAYTTYFTGMELLVKIANANGIGVSNLNVNALGNKAIQLFGSVTPAPGQLPVGHVAHLIYNGTNFTLLNPAHAFQGIYAQMSANQSISGTDTPVVWKTSVYDTMGFSTGSTYSIVTVPTGYGISYIRISATADWATATVAATGFSVRLYKNGAYFNLQVVNYDSTGLAEGIEQLFVSPVLNTTAGDTWAINVRQNSGGALNLVAAETWLQLEVLQ